MCSKLICQSYLVWYRVQTTNDKIRVIKLTKNTFKLVALLRSTILSAYMFYNSVGKNKA